MGGNVGRGGGGDSGHNTQDVVCGGLWRDVVEENGTKMGEWEKNGTKYLFFSVPFSPLLRRLKIFPPVPFVKISSLHSPTEKGDFLPLTDAHHHGS